MPHLNVAALTPAWFLIRQEPGNATASNCGKYVGIDEYEISRFPGCYYTKEDILEAWRQARDPPKGKGGNFYTRWGNFYEDTSVLAFEIALKIKVGKSNYWQHDEYEWLFATPDGLLEEYLKVTDNEPSEAVLLLKDRREIHLKNKQAYIDFLKSIHLEDPTGCILEIKNPQKIHAEPPPHYICQMQVQMDCSNRKLAYFMSTSIRQDIARIWKVRYSTEYINWLIPQLYHWHNTAVDKHGQLDLTKFDRKPPFVAYEFVCEIRSLKNLLGNIPVYDEIFTEESKKWGSEPVYLSSITTQETASEPFDYSLLYETVDYRTDENNTKKKRPREEAQEDPRKHLKVADDLYYDDLVKNSL